MRSRPRGLAGEVTGWHRTERWLAVFSLVASVAAMLGWVGAVATGSGGLSVVMLAITVATTAFALLWVMRPDAMRWWSGLVVLVVALGPAAVAFIILGGSIARVAGLFTLVTIWLAATTVIRRYEMPPVRR